MKTEQLCAKIFLFIFGIALLIGGISALRLHMNPNYYMLEIIAKYDNYPYPEFYSEKMLIQLNTAYRLELNHSLPTYTFRVSLLSEYYGSIFVINWHSSLYSDEDTIFHMDLDNTCYRRGSYGSLEDIWLNFEITDDIPKTYIGYFVGAAACLFLYFDLGLIIESIQEDKKEKAEAQAKIKAALSK